MDPRCGLCCWEEKREDRCIRRADKTLLMERMVEERALRIDEAGELEREEAEEEGGEEEVEEEGKEVVMVGGEGRKKGIVKGIVGYKDTGDGLWCQVGIIDKGWDARRRRWCLGFDGLLNTWWWRR